MCRMELFFQSVVNSMHESVGFFVFFLLVWECKVQNKLSLCTLRIVRDVTWNHLELQ